jgi:hypothetical protein
MNTLIIQTVDHILQTTIGKPINDLQVHILHAAATRTPYAKIAISLNCTEGHIRDTAYKLWQLLTQYFGHSISKTNVIIKIEEHISRISKKNQDLEKYSAHEMDASKMKEDRKNIIQSLRKKEFSEQQIREVLKILNREQKSRLEV